jgi:cyclic pyranopterin phosphate synthase
VTYIDPRAKALGYMDRLVAWNSGQKPAPVTVEWDLSNRCVLGCQSCHFAHTHTRGPWAVKGRSLPMAYDSGGDLADSATVVTGLIQMAALGVKSIVWSGGGEPTTHPEWQKAVEAAAACGLEQGMYTLGGLLDDAGAQLLAEHCTWVVVSLDCQDAQTYSKEKGVPEARFYSACDGVRRLASHKKATVGVSFLLHGNNWYDVRRMYTLGMELGADYVTFRPTIETQANHPSVCAAHRGWVDAAIPLLQHVACYPKVEIDISRFEAYRDWQGHGYSACEGIRLNATITPDGRVWVCPQRRGVGTPIGNLSTESFADIWARHPGHFVVDDGCRVMCRLHPVNSTLHALSEPRLHGAFV